LAAYARAINAGPGKEVYSFYLDGLAKFQGKRTGFPARDRIAHAAPDVGGAASELEEDDQQHGTEAGKAA
jgi:hypothetical protein